METTKQVYAQDEREIEDSEFLDLVATISQTQDTKAADFINNAVQTALAKSLGYSYTEFGLIGLTPSERFETVHLVAERDGLTAADFVREAILAAVAGSINLDEEYLKDILGKSEPWVTIYC